MNKVKEFLIYTILIVLLCNFLLATFMITQMLMVSWLY
jgi:hypothetical protein